MLKHGQHDKHSTLIYPHGTPKQALPMTDSVLVSAAANVALVKYWGKRPGTGNQPATPSLSIGLDDLRSETRLSFVDGPHDVIHEGLGTGLGDSTGEANPTTLDDKATQRIVRYLNQFRQDFGLSCYFQVETQNNFPTGSGLASSASGFAALALALNALNTLNLNATALTQLARRGSGSAARSIFGGYVEIVTDDDAWARQIAVAEDWPLDVLVAVTASGPKAINSTDAMVRTAQTSPVYDAWLSSHAADMAAAKAAIVAHDFAALAQVSEHNCLKMHATMMTSQPAILYWLPGTIEVMHRVAHLRHNGCPVFFSIDAGAQVKVICAPDVTAQVRDALIDAPGVLNLIETKVGGDPVVTLSA